MRVDELNTDGTDESSMFVIFYYYYYYLLEIAGNRRTCMTLQTVNK